MLTHQVITLHNPTTVARFSEAARDSSLLHSVRADCGVHPASSSKGIGDSFLGGKAAKGVKMTTHFIRCRSRDTSTPPYFFKIRCLINFQTASVVHWSHFLATDPDVSESTPGATRFCEKSWSGAGSTQPREDN
jgi:hypothetical protein